MKSLSGLPFCIPAPITVTAMPIVTVPIVAVPVTIIPRVTLWRL